jgi:hypothetical protein
MNENDETARSIYFDLPADFTDLDTEIVARVFDHLGIEQNIDSDLWRDATNLVSEQVINAIDTVLTNVRGWHLEHLRSIAPPSGPLGSTAVPSDAFRPPERA